MSAAILNPPREWQCPRCLLRTRGVCACNCPVPTSEEADALLTSDQKQRLAAAALRASTGGGT